MDFINIQPISRIEKYAAKLAGMYSGFIGPPLSRTEVYLDALNGNDHETFPVPQSSVEKYLAYLIGIYTGALPEPKLNLEIYLSKMANLYVGDLPKPETRLEYYFYQIASGFVDKLTYVEGNNIVLPNTPIEEPIPKLHIFGKSRYVEDRIPTEDNPNAILPDPIANGYQAILYISSGGYFMEGTEYYNVRKYTLERGVPYRFRFFNGIHNNVFAFGSKNLEFLNSLMLYNYGYQNQGLKVITQGDISGPCRLPMGGEFTVRSTVDNLTVYWAANGEHYEYDDQESQICFESDYYSDLPQMFQRYRVRDAISESLQGIPTLPSKATYVDENGQPWLADEMHLEDSKLIKRTAIITDYDEETHGPITTPYLSSTGSLSEGAYILYGIDPEELTLDSSDFKEKFMFKSTTTLLSNCDIWMKAGYKPTK